MSCSPEGLAAEQLTAVLDALATADVVALDDETLRGHVRDLMSAYHRIHAELVRRLDVFDRRGLAELDGFHGTKSWLQAFTRVSGVVAHRLVRAARVMRRLPKLAIAAQTGEVSGDHVQQVVQLVDHVGAAPVAEADATLADAATQLDLRGFTALCARVRHTWIRMVPTQVRISRSVA